MAFAVVSVPSESASGSYLVSVTSGLSVMTLSERLRTGAAPVSLEGGPPTIHYGGLVNSATMTHDLSPGVLASLFGKNFVPEAAASRVALGVDSPRQADAVRVTFDGQDAIVFGVAPTQINLQIPPSLKPGSAEMRVHVGNVASEAMLVQLARVSPGAFGVARQDHSLVQTDSPAARGETLWLLATGLGDVPQRSSAGTPLDSLVKIQVGSARPRVEAIDAVSGMAGLYRIRFTLPESLAGTLEVLLLVDGRRGNIIELAVGR